MSRDNLLTQHMGISLNPDALDRLDSIMRYLISREVSGRKVVKSHAIEWALLHVKIPPIKKEDN